MRKLFAVPVLLLFFSCGRKNELPPGILEPPEMQAVFWDYIRADVFAWDIIKRDPSRNDTIENLQLQKKIFSYYNITREDFYRSYRYYSDHPEMMNALIDSITAMQNRRNLQYQRPSKSKVKSIYE